MQLLALKPKWFQLLQRVDKMYGRNFGASGLISPHFLGTVASRSALLLLQLSPSRVESVDRFLRLFQLNASFLQKRGVAGDRGIFQRNAFRVHLPFRFGDALFYACEFSRLNIRKFFLSRLRW